MAEDDLARAREGIGRRLADIDARWPRLSSRDLHLRMEAIRRIAADHGLLALEGLARRSAQLALLPGHRVAVRSCLQHAADALDSHSPEHCDAILAAVAIRLH